MKTSTGKEIVFIETPTTDNQAQAIQTTVRTPSGLILWNEPTPKSATRNALEWLGIAAIFAAGVIIAVTCVL